MSPAEAISVVTSGIALLETIEPDAHLAGTLLSLNKIMPETKATARQVVALVVADVEKRVADKTGSAVSGALHRAARAAAGPLP